MMVCSFQVCRLQSEGYYGGMRLLMAICKVFYNYCSDNKIELKGGNFTLSYETNIPRQVKFWGQFTFCRPFIHMELVYLYGFVFW